MTARIALLVCFLLGRVSAQPLSAVGQPLPDPRLTAGTVSVRVVAGEISKPAADVPVTLTVGGKPKIVKTDASGRAQFDGIAAKARITVSLPSTAPELARSTFLMPDAGGVRLFLSTAKWKLAGAPPSPRELGGKPRPDPDVAAGSLAVRVTYDDLDDPKPPSGLVVTLVGYAHDGKVSTVAKATDGKGVALFTGLDVSERTAYFAFAQLPRNGIVDRLRSDPITLDRSAGQRVVLSSFGRTAKDPAIDPETMVVPKGKARVAVSGATSIIELLDAATGKVLATGPANATELALAAKPGQLVYAQTTKGTETYRSRPLPVVADRGAGFSIAIVPRLPQRFDLIAIVDDNFLAFQMRMHLENFSWRPTPGGHDVVLPTGFQGLVFRDEDEPYAKATPKGFRVDAPLPPGGRSVILGFSLPIVNQRAKVALELPQGTLDSSLRLKADPGVAFAELPAGLSATPVNKFLSVGPITQAPGTTIQFAVTAPKPDPKQIAIRKACKDLAPNLESPLLGKPLVDFTAPRLDGKPFTLSSLKGKLIFVTFNASWTNLRDDQKTLPALAKQLGAELVTVLSDRDPAEVTKAIGPLPAATVLDEPVGESALGPITGRWNIVAVPETYVIDRKGAIKFHVVNQRDWSLPSTRGCLETGI